MPRCLPSLMLGSLVVLAALALEGCGARNYGERCNAIEVKDDFLNINSSTPIPIIVGELSCAPGRCDPDAGVCVECLQDLDCMRLDALDRPKCMMGLPSSQGGDGLPFCKHYADHAACNYPGASEFICLPGKCSKDAGVCVDCFEDKDCPPDRPVCKTGPAPDHLTSCVKKDKDQDSEEAQ